ncbi:hypothetical protein IID24_04315 [Patescibacteria group bacterium]|nr:hypothetical protein [Patescibacteria group bacterium]
MYGIEAAYCNAGIQAALFSAQNVLEARVEDLVEFTRGYGKGDTLGMDAIPEQVIHARLVKFNPRIRLITEELGKDWKDSDLPSPPVVCISDPTDRSAFLKDFLERLGLEARNRKFKDILSEEGMSQKWERECKGGPALISGATTAITGIREGNPFFNVTVNYITQHIFVACQAGVRMFKINSWRTSDLEQITLELILQQGEKITFTKEAPKEFDDSMRYYTFLGKSGYPENLEKAKIFLSGGDENLIYGEPGGPTRILYLSSLYEESPVGFILANGEKISEWIHWLPYVAASIQDGSPLRVFEIAFEEPLMRNGLLMATSPEYSIFSIDNTGTCRINIAKIRDFPNPSQYRATLVIAPENNEWIATRMEGHGYRRLTFRFPDESGM